MSDPDLVEIDDKHDVTSESYEVIEEDNAIHENEDTEELEYGDLKFRDSTDFFDGAIFLEDSIIERGKVEGRVAGLQKGFRDGEVLGSRHGRSLGEEIGFYVGFVHTWLSLMAKEANIALDELLSIDLKDQEALRQYSSQLSRYQVLIDGPRALTDSKKHKVAASLNQLGVLLHAFPLLAPENHDLQDALAFIRAKFRVCIVRMSLIGYFNQKQESISF